MSASKLSPHQENKMLSPSSGVSSKNLEQQTIMVVDDYDSNLQAMKRLFESHYNVVLFNNGKEAIDYAQRDGVDLILLDVDMPEMHGYEACKKLKSNSPTAHIPIIFVTASDSIRDETKGLLLGAVDYVTKPVNLTILRARVRNHMELVYYRKKLEFLSSIDGLTGVANRRQLDKVCHRIFTSTVRFGQYLSLLMIDIDNFKSYNDIYGHMQGDECLKQVANTIQENCRETDFVGRYGGEEFAMLLPDTDLEGGIIMANKLLHAVNNLNIRHEGATITEKVTISIGLAVFRANSNQPTQISFEALIESADKQLYKAKHSGKNRVKHFVMDEEAERLEVKIRNE